MMFKNRAEAGRTLAAKLAPLISKLSVVAAIPRGGVAVALPIIEQFKLPLTVVYARKLTAPIAPELAFGAIDEDGKAIIDASTAAMLDLSPDDIEKAKTRVAAEIQRRMTLYRVPPLAHYLPGKAVVLIDDGLATGMTMRAAVAYARRHGALEITVAAPCASEQAAERFQLEADHFVSLIVDPEFGAVGAYYIDFSPVPDEDVIRLLARARETQPPPASSSALRVSFKNSRGLLLAGELLIPVPGRPHPAVVFAHGWGSGKASPRNRAVAEALAAEGIASFLFDFTGHGESEGKKEECTPAQQIDDLRAAINVLEDVDEIDRTRLGLMGAGSGASIALLLAAESQKIRALVLRSGKIEGAEESAPRVRIPTLLVVGEDDKPTRAPNEALLSHLGGPRCLEVVPGGDHIFENPVALRQAIAFTVDWFKGYLR